MEIKAQEDKHSSPFVPRFTPYILTEVSAQPVKTAGIIPQANEFPSNDEEIAANEISYSPLNNTTTTEDTSLDHDTQMSGFNQKCCCS